MEIKIYAPVDCEVKSLDKCSDSAFAQKLLGDGILIIPNKNDFSMPFDRAKVIMVFDTKHAYGLEIDDLGILIHCGIETVNLKGEPFKTRLKPNTNLSKGDKLFSVDLEMLKDKKISNETPLVFDKDVLIKNFKEGDYKQGELICTVEYKKEVKNIESLEDFFNVKNKYQSIAFDLNKFVGSKANYQQVYNCMTRLRFTVKDKSLVNEDAIKKMPICKQLLWNGSELQVVIGQDVYKVKDEIMLQNEFLESNYQVQKQTKSAAARFIGVLGGTMVRMIPIMTGAGLIQALMAILVLSGVMPSIVTSREPLDPRQVSLFDPELATIWVAIFIMGRCTSYFTGVAIAYVAADRFKLNPIYGIGIGLILSAPIIFADGGASGIGLSYTWIHIEDIHTSNEAFNNITKIFSLIPLGTKVFVILPIIYISAKIDKWVVRWMPSALELMFRPFILFLFSGMFGFFILTPAWMLIEVLFGALMIYVGNIPFGVGVGAYVALWQICVIFGLHGTLGIAIRIEGMANGGWSYLGIAGSLSVWAQLGALVGVAIITRNQLLKKQAYGMIPMGILGITEPILYGINLPKKRPLICGVIAAFIGGALLNWLHVSNRAQTGIGIFEALGFFVDPMLGGVARIEPLQNGLLYLMGVGITIGIGVGLTMLFYKERIEEKTLINRTTIKLIDFLFKNKEIDLNLKPEIIKARTELKNLYTKEEIKFLRNQEKKFIQKYIKVLAEIETKKERRERLIEKMFKKGQVWIKKNNTEKALFAKEYIDNLAKQDFADLEKHKDELYSLIDFEKIESIKKEKLDRIYKILDYINKKAKFEIENYKEEYKKDTSSLLINYGI
ncbi:PTS glucose transporter subunit IIABC [Spiroplasma monobiae]|uniref:PTS system beta-glucoside-specific IIABC component n=1 Tax=Spiroplasma monobiae MQ-1 TaxID=1336748 RepID=A0A2K9LUJ5_SPISQ|nr:PTS glucose transporter subunit IIABC [Spiroplasma monobiae]AUM62719.1 PTS system beta-glucoside-specific IIABC component [Spiroplasma monobiae MQ-1]